MAKQLAEVKVLVSPLAQAVPQVHNWIVFKFVVEVGNEIQVPYVVIAAQVLATQTGVVAAAFQVQALSVVAGEQVAAVVKAPQFGN